MMRNGPKMRTTNKSSVCWVANLRIKIFSPNPGHTFNAPQPTVIGSSLVPHSRTVLPVSIGELVRPKQETFTSNTMPVLLTRSRNASESFVLIPGDGTGPASSFVLRHPCAEVNREAHEPPIGRNNNHDPCIVELILCELRVDRQPVASSRR